MSEKKIVGITMGDPASIGPEITVKAFADKSLYDLCNPVVVGDAGVMEAALPIVGHTEMKINAIKMFQRQNMNTGPLMCWIWGWLIWHS